MGRNAKTAAAAAMEASKSKLEVRADIISYIRNERDTVLKKWMALEESVKSEDRLRDKFYKEIVERETAVLPITIQKIIGSLKKAVRQEMRYKGGTALSIIRHMFIYWDADKSGEISAKELHAAMKSLGVIMTEAEREEVVAYYDSGKGQNEMNYDRLLKDIQRGEPSLLAFVDRKEEEAKSENEARFAEVVDKFKQIPKRVQQFVEATQDYVSYKLRYEGGTPELHVRYLFTWFDYDYSGGLSVDELMIAASKGMNLELSKKDAEDIIDYFSTKLNRPELLYDDFIKAVTTVIKPVMHHIEVTPESWIAAKESLAKNPFIRRPWGAPRNKVLTDFKRAIMDSCQAKIKSTGGSVRTWIQEAFSKWDNLCIRKLVRTEQLIGFAKRLGVTLCEDDAAIIMKCYDRYNTGEMYYKYFIEEMNELDPHFISDAPVDYSRTEIPNKASSLVDRLKSSCEKFSFKSKGCVRPCDVLHGTFLRYDYTGSGKVTSNDIKSLCRDLKVASASDAEIEQMVTWFDADGNGLCDYNALVKSIYGFDVSNRTLSLPHLSSNGRATVTMVGTRPGDPKGTMFNTKVVPNQRPIDTSDLSGVQLKNLRVIESAATKATRRKTLKKEILLEKQKIQEKIASIEQQQQFIVEDYNKRHQKLKKW